jgi:hypothetical protein
MKRQKREENINSARSQLGRTRVPTQIGEVLREAG